MYYAFEQYKDIPPIKINGFERPRGKLHCFESRQDRAYFMQNNGRMSVISSREARLLAPVAPKQLTLYAKVFKEEVAHA